MKIEILRWDSDFFNYPVGICYIDVETNLDVSEVNKKTRPFKLVYFVSNTPLEEYKTYDLLFVDNKITFVKDVTYDSTVPVLNLSEEKDFSEQLMSLAIQSGEFSRFKIDPNFKNSEFERLYSIWIQRNLTDKSNRKVLTYYGERSVLAFVAITIESDNLIIDLIAVDNKLRGRGLGKGILAYLNAFCVSRGLKRLFVSTQNANVRAIEFYKKGGFEISKSSFIYHYWNDQYTI